MPNNRIAIFIDAGYLEQVLKKEFPGIDVDYAKLVQELAPPPNDLLRAYYYNCPPYQGNPPSPDEIKRKADADRFYAALKRIARFEVRLGRLARRSCDNCKKVFFQQKRADIMLGVDLTNLSAKQTISTAILISGDSDMIPAVLVAKDCGVVVHLYHGGRLNPPHEDLYAACDERTQFDRALISRVRR